MAIFLKLLSASDFYVINAIAIIVSKITSHCAGTVQMREESESDGRLFHKREDAIGNALSPTVDRRVRRTSRDVDEAERSHRLNSVSAGRRSSSRRYVGARPCWHCTPKK